MTLAKAKLRAYETYIVQASITIVTYDHQNTFIVQATGDSVTRKLNKILPNIWKKVAKKYQTIYMKA